MSSENLSVIGCIKEKLHDPSQYQPNEKQQIISGTSHIDSWYKLANHHMC